MEKADGSTFGQVATTGFFGIAVAGRRWCRASFGDDVRPGTYKAILRQTRIKEDWNDQKILTILVTGKSIDELTRRATGAIQLWWEMTKPAASPTALRKEIEVELPVG